MSGVMFGPYKAHPIANKFDMLDGEALASMAQSIKENGQAIPCVLWGDLLLDGRNRWRACELAGVEPWVEQRDFADYKAAGRWIMAVNWERRHSTPGERAMMMSDPEVYDLWVDEAKERQVANLRRGTEAPVMANLPQRGGGLLVNDGGGILRARDPGATTARAQAALAAGVSPRTIQSAVAVRQKGVPELIEAASRGEVAISAAEQLTKLPPDEQREVVAAGPEAVREVAAEIRKQPANFTSLSDLWFTPAKVIDAARELMGGFDLDPASCAEANETVGAATFFTQEDDGLAQTWHGRVWCNPPYGRDSDDNKSNQAKWTAYMADQYDAGNFVAGCLLVTFVPDRSWFERLWNYPMCAFRDRLKFRTPGGNVPASPTSANVVVYFGDDAEGFARIFSRFGRVIPSRKQWPDAEVADVAA